MKRGKMQVSKSPLILVFNLIGREREWREYDKQIRERSKAKTITI